MILSEFESEKSPRRRNAHITICGRILGSIKKVAVMPESVQTSYIPFWIMYIFKGVHNYD